ncbi:MAG TPA: hypothetical protein VH105_06045 [Burkholderiales bacterium]|nr:hypothetical protein [Burkholderiales bacterium]
MKRPYLLATLFALSTVALNVLLDALLWGRAWKMPANQTLQQALALHVAFHVFVLILSWLGAAMACTMLMDRLPSWRVMALAAAALTVAMFFIFPVLLTHLGLLPAGLGHLVAAALFAGAACLLGGRRAGAGSSG